MILASKFKIKLLIDSVVKYDAHFFCVSLVPFFKLISLVPCTTIDLNITAGFITAGFVRTGSKMRK